MKKQNPKNNISDKLKIPQEVTEFLKDEKGFVSKETMLKTGLMTLSGLVLLSEHMSQAATEHTNVPRKHVSGAPKIVDLAADGSSVTVQHSSYATPHNNHDSY